jgi:hypothetical protein
MEVQRKTPKAPLQQKATQVRRETKQKIKSDVKQNNQRLELNKEFPSIHAAQAKKLRKPNRQETPEAKLRHKSCASPTRNKQQIQSREPNKIITCHHRSNKKLRKPNRKPRKSKHNKKLFKPDTKQKNQPRELHKAFSFAPLKQIKNYESPTADPESTTPTHEYNRASSTKFAPVTTAPT